VTTADGRAVCFVTGEPSGLSVTLPKALAELAKAVPPGTPIMLGFDRGGAYPAVVAHCRDNGVHWVTYRRAPLAVPQMLPVPTTITVNGKTRTIAWAEETVQLKDYGDARQITLSEHGRVVLQILTSDSGACPAALLGWLKSRWREENYLKYASENYGIDAICDYAADIEANTKIVDNPARKNANAAVREAEKTLAAAERGLAVLLADPAIAPAVKNTRLIPAAEREIAAARRQLAAAKKTRDAIPAKLPANQIDPQAQVALLRTGRRGLQMVLRLLAHNAEHWLSGQLNAYLRDDDEYRAGAPPRNHHPRHRRHHRIHPRGDHRHPAAARRAAHRPRLGSAHRPGQRHPAADTRRHPAHHLPAHREPGNLTPGRPRLPEIWGPARSWTQATRSHEHGTCAEKGRTTGPVQHALQTPPPTRNRRPKPRLTPARSFRDECLHREAPHQFLRYDCKRTS
jgi:hypothetical protein